MVNEIVFDIGLQAGGATANAITFDIGLQATAATAPTGTSALTIPLPTISATGQITYQGTSALTIPIPTIAAAGTAGTPGTVTGTSAVTIPLPLISAQGLIAGYSAPSFVEFQSSLFAYMDRRPLDLLPVIENSFWAKNVDENFRRIEEWLEPLTRNNPEGLELFAQMFGGVLVSGHVAASTAADATGDSTFEHGLRAVPRFVFWHARTDDVSASPDRILYFPAGGKGSLGANHQPWDAERVHVRASDSGTYTFIVM